ncbi:lytic murein transglycosylase [Chelatococcus sp. SYSU_G07232]|uniref:Lytic murein transglycosylase n=1 Tax=Chelatococcus albus TaxID=3047466 RepID=A0ABT7AG20_9HYPH|nr:lytic murein transglycosylase [Chelatococcus sp. SYSU_G07232]MDJ1158315.1 lytic murein transglycosylase [Chelatococcus sp. SYSU_G07232]
MAARTAGGRMRGAAGRRTGIGAIAAIAASLALAACASNGILPGVASMDEVETTSGRGAPQPAAFAAFVEELWPAARARGVSRRTFDAAFAGVSPDQKVLDLTKKQSEFVKPIWEYLASAVSEKRLEKGPQMAAQYASTLAAVEQTYGVDRKVIMGVWGMETNFGGFTGNNYVVQALATLAYARYRGDYFRNELVTALKILDDGHVSPADMQGSWAGAMGQTQFMPSSFVRYAVDFTGDGKRDIWTSVPDALASTANYLKMHGWQTGLPWGFEVQLPPGYSHRVRKQSFAHWAQAGVRRMDGKAMPAEGEASLFMPAGARGPVFLVTKNFAVIKRYNNSDAYALGVAHLGDRVYGGPAIQASWPVEERQLTKDERHELQRRLALLGYDVGEPDGRLGTQTRDAIVAFQESRGLVPDGYPDSRLLAYLRQTADPRS